MLEVKEKFLAKHKIDSLLTVASILETLDEVIPNNITMTAEDSRLVFWPDTETTARRLVGNFIMLLKSKPKIEKCGTTQLMATFNYSDITITIYGYKGRKCATVKKTIVHEAVPETVVPAKAAWVEEVEELICEMPAVEAEVTSQAEGVQAVITAEEVPF